MERSPIALTAEELHRLREAYGSPFYLLLIEETDDEELREGFQRAMELDLAAEERKTKARE